MIFLGFLARSPHLQLLTEDEYKKLMTEMPVALKALRGNTMNSHESPLIKGKFLSIEKNYFIIKQEMNCYIFSLYL